MRRATLLIIYLVLIPGLLCAETVKIGIDNNPPLTFTDKQGHASGLFPDLFNQLAQQKDWSIQYYPCQWNQCLELLEAGTIDILPAIAHTPKRALKYNFASQTVFTSWGQIYHRQDKPISSVLELNGKSCAVLKNDIYYIGEQGLKQVADSFDLNIDIVEVESNRAAFELLAKKKVDAAMVGRIFGVQKFHEYSLLPAPIMIKPIQIRPAFSKSASSSLVHSFDNFLKTKKNNPNSSYYQLIDKWFGENHKQTIPQWFLPFIAAIGGVLTLLTASTFWTRKQVRVKTLELADKNDLLERELEERAMIEQKLLDSQEQYRTFFEDSHSIMLLIDPEDASIVDANPAACGFYKYPREHMKTMKMWHINRLGEAEVQKRLTEVRNLEQQCFEFVHTLADGQEVPVEVYRSPIKVKGKPLLYTIVHDISKRKKAEQALEEHNSFLQSVMDGVSDPMMVINFDFQILMMNQAAREQLKNGFVDNETICCHELSHMSTTPCNSDDHPCPLLEVKETGQPVTVVHQHDSDQGKRIVELIASPLFNNKGEAYAIIEVARDITERLQIEELLNENEKRLLHLAHHDPLTNLPNRLLFDDRLKQALSKARRSRRQVALFFLDLDNFKLVNDTLGHDFGDLLLIDVAKRLRKTVREGDTVARLGGDEFLILLEDFESVDIIETTAQRICTALTHELKKDEFVQQVSASIGISIYPEDASSAQSLMKNADLAMYRAKNIGKAGYQFYSAPQGRFIFD